MAESTKEWRVRSLAAEDEKRWDDFVRGLPSATFFHLSGWRNVVGRAFGHASHYLYAERDGAMGGVLPLFHINSRLFTNALVSTPFCSYGGVAAADAEVAGALTNAAEALARDLDVDYLEMRNLNAGARGWPDKDLYVTFRTQIDGNPDVNFKALSGKRRNMVRRARRNGLTTDISGEIDGHYAVYAEMVRNLGTPVYSRRYFRLLKDEFGGDCEVLRVMHNDSVVSSMMSFFFRDEMLVYYGGGTRRARDLAANDYLYWSLIERAAERGARTVDFGRSKRGSGSYRFKELWGWEPRQLHYEYRLLKTESVPNLSPTNPKYRPLITAWKRLPVPLTRLIGPPLARNLG
ncbi:MAG TPA: FemAB family XrtA/PEP-CTERM system-associated protein [Gammaproteobacteria bacterium]|nr:FemAB family XrtA/PEP-CTERM system-associated protein [Gammaproteobacteria bacterium]